MPAGATAVATSPESCVSALARSDGERLKRFKNPSGSVAPPATALSSPVATENLIGRGRGWQQSYEEREPGGPEAGVPPDPWMTSHNEIVLVSNVTAPVFAQAAPQVIFAAVSSVMLVCARMSPVNDVPVPSVAELPTCQNTLPPCAPLISINSRSAGSGQRAPNLKDED